MILDGLPKSYEKVKKEIMDNLWPTSLLVLSSKLIEAQVQIRKMEGGMVNNSTDLRRKSDMAESSSQPNVIRRKTWSWSSYDIYVFEQWKSYFALFTLLNFWGFFILVHCLVLISYGLLMWNFIPRLSIVFLDYQCHFIMLALLDKWSFDYPIIYDIKCNMVNIKMFTCD